MRDTTDRRTVRIRLTERGHALIDELIVLHSANSARLLDVLGRDESDRLAGSLRTLLTSLGDKPIA
ncbi:hypothetical protein GCM10020221_23810 [Streptomyces thioluteus]|uniref:MarR family transcriptional regulator n=1 Tax=Streptomyces thioluteus TaxID=66431 RepID=A0ABN3WWK9_STRTU